MRSRSGKLGESDEKIEQNRITEGNPAEINGVQEARRKGRGRLENGRSPIGIKKTTAKII